MAPIDAAETLPYSVVNSPRVVADELQHRAQVLQVEQQQPVVVRDLEDEREHALLGRVQAEQPAEQQRPEVGNRRADRKPAAAEHVPEHDRAGAPTPARRCRSPSAARAASATAEPAAASPDRSPLTSARKTGTPIREKCSASTCSVTVLPVPVAPVIRPCRFASAGRNSTSSPDDGLGDDKRFAHWSTPSWQTLGGRLELDALTSRSRDAPSAACANSGPLPSSSCLK